MRIENLDWQNRVIFAPDSKPGEGSDCSNEWVSLRNSANQVRFKTGRLGISLEALRVSAHEVNLQSLPKARNKVSEPATLPAR